MRFKKFIKGVLEVTFSNIFTIIAGIITGFVIPKILSVEDYGLYKTFTLYVTYLGLFSLGIIDGIVLKYGGHDWEDFDKNRFRSYFKWYMIVNSLFAVVLIVVGLIVPDNDYRFIILMLGIDLVATNVSGYFQQISQITQRFKEYSTRKILQSVCNILIAFFLYIIYKKKGTASYQTYVVMLVTVNILLALWYVWTYRELVFGTCLRIKNTKVDVQVLIKIGVPLMVSNLCSTLMLTLDRQFVNLLFDTSSYAIYAFAYNMLSLVTVATSAITTVLYPTLKRTSDADMKENYGFLTGSVMILVYFACACYFPLCAFVEWFLPNYAGSLQIFRIIFPGLAISCSITVVMHNYYKALGKSALYFKKSIIILCISAFMNLMAYFLFGTMESISIASVVTMVIWYIYVEKYFVDGYDYKRSHNMVYLLLMMACFYFTSFISYYAVGLVVYIVMFTVITISQMKNVFYRVKKMLNK